MRVIRKNFRPGSHVIFTYNNCLYSGIISSIGVREYGITMLNATKDVTDHECMLRIHNEVYIPKRNCIRTSELAIPEVVDCTKLIRGYIDVDTAYRIGRKKQIFPWYSTTRFSEVFIRFDSCEYINKLIFIISDDESEDLKCLYYRTVDGHSFLEDIDGNRYNADWKYHKRSPRKYEKSYNEYDVVRIYLLNSCVNTYDVNRIRDIMKKGIDEFVDVLYRYENIPFKEFTDTKQKVTKPYLSSSRMKPFDCYGTRKNGLSAKCTFVDETWYECLNQSKEDERKFEKINGFDV